MSPSSTLCVSFSHANLYCPVLSLSHILSQILIANYHSISLTSMLSHPLCRRYTITYAFLFIRTIGRYLQSLLPDFNFHIYVSSNPCRERTHSGGRVGGGKSIIQCLVSSSVTRLGDLLDFGQLFKAFGNN